MTDASATGETPQAASEISQATSAAPKIKTRLPYQRACNEKDAKGKLCSGHLKRWYGFSEEIKKQYGADAEIYRCEHCHTVYLPTPGFDSRSGTLQF
jgi:hypothetical protein